MCSSFDISNTDFIRTTEKRHHKAVQHFWNVLFNKGYIYKSTYQGWYSVIDETFVSSSQIEEREVNGQLVKVSSESGHTLEWFEEENYMFRLSNFIDQLKVWLKSDKCLIKPALFYDLVFLLLNQDLPDLSISRPKSRLSWGITVPNDDSQIVIIF